MRKPKKIYDDEFKETIRELYNTGKDVNMLSEEWIYVNILDTIFFVFMHIFSQIL